MSKRRVMVPLDSFRLAQYAVETYCYICDGGNTFDADLCRHCKAPMALSHQAGTPRRPPHLIGTVGPIGSGKTVYLGMLADLLSRQQGDLQILCRGAFSISLQQATIGALGGSRFPDRTPLQPDHWHWLHCEVRRSGKQRSRELVLPDVSGEAVIGEVDHPRTFPVVRALFEKSAGIMIMIDTHQLEEGDQAPDFLTMKIISYLCELEDQKKRIGCTRPIALVFAKADVAEQCFESPERYAERRTPGLWQQCRDRLKNFRFFAAGVAGAYATERQYSDLVHIPLRIEPRGLIEPFEWLIDQFD